MSKTIVGANLMFALQTKNDEHIRLIYEKDGSKMPDLLKRIVR